MKRNWLCLFLMPFFGIAQPQSESKSVGSQLTPITIPVIVHVIHSGQAVGIGPNLSQLQINSQISVLNADFNGSGYKSTTYPATAFTTFASALPAASKDVFGRIKIADMNVVFCLATKDTLGNTLAEPGIHRVNHTSLIANATYPYTNPAHSLINSASKLVAFMDSIIKPQTIWNPSKYLNIWVSDYNSTAVTGLNCSVGFATYPILSGLTGLPSNLIGTSTTDGIWVPFNCFGTSGILAPGYDRGRSATHLIGHYLGLRHIWGDTNCGIDYCNDTPPAATQNFTAVGYPFHSGTCSGNSPDGEMYMNFMDNSFDSLKYMFTYDQSVRASVALSNSPYRNQMGTHGLCSYISSPSVANFTLPSFSCSSFTLNNSSTGGPVPSYTWSSVPSLTFIPNSNFATPLVNYSWSPTPVSYSITLSASNGTLSSITKTIQILNCNPPYPCVSIMNDTSSNFSTVDTLGVITTGTVASGYISGNNGYGDKAIGEMYQPFPGAVLAGVTILFYRDAVNNIGTKGNSILNLKIWLNVSSANGPIGPSAYTHTINLANVLSLTPRNNVKFCGVNNYTYAASTIYAASVPMPFSFPFMNGNTFIALEYPTTTGDTAVVFTNKKSYLNQSTAWRMKSNNTWYKFNDITNGWGKNLSSAICIRTYCPVNIDELNDITRNFNLYPNPGNGKFDLIFTLEEKKNLNIRIHNSIGQIIHEQKEYEIKNNIISFDLTGNPSGLYIMSISDQNGQKSTRKFVID